MTHDETTLRLDPLRALRALLALTKDPDDTSQVFAIVDAFSLHAPARIMRAFRASAAGRRLLAERPDIVPLLADRATLRRLPDGSLGRAYLAFVEGEGITASGLVAASEAGRGAVADPGSDLEYVGTRIRDTHDLWHTLTGYRGDLVGEAALLAFNIPQTWNPGIALIVLVGLLRLRDVGATRTILDGLRRGRRARWLPAVEWERLLALPLDEVRASLNVEPTAPYEELRTEMLRATGMLAPLAV